MSIQDFSKDFVEKNTLLDKRWANIQAQTNEVSRLIEKYFHSLNDNIMKLWCEYLNSSYEDLEEDYEATEEKYGHLGNQIDELGSKVFNVLLGLNKRTLSEVHHSNVDFFSEEEDVKIAVKDLLKEYLSKKKL